MGRAGRESLGLDPSGAGAVEINLDHPDDNCNLDYVPHHSRPLAITYALSNSFGFGGTNAALLFKRFEA